MMPGAWISMRRSWRRRCGPLPSMGSPRAFDDAAEQAVADGHRQDPAGGLDRLALLDALDVAEHHGADRVLVEVQGQAERAVLELEQLVDAALGQAGRRGRCRRRPRATRPTVRGLERRLRSPSRFFWSAAVMSAVLMVSSAMAVVSLRARDFGAGRDGGGRSRR